MSTTATPMIKRYCKRKQVMCEYANEMAYCKGTACVYPLNMFPKTYKLVKYCSQGAERKEP